jgi:hypothetical protein
MQFNEGKRGQLKKLLSKHYPLIGILVGSALLSISFGPLSSWDSQIEFAAGSGAVK